MCTSRYWSPSSAKVTAATLQGMKKGVWVLSWCRHAGAWVLSSTTAWSLPFSLGLWTALPKKLQRLDLLQIVFAYIPHNQKARAKLISRMLSLIRLRLIETHTHIYIYIHMWTHIYTYTENITGFGILMSWNTMMTKDGDDDDDDDHLGDDHWWWSWRWHDVDDDDGDHDDGDWSQHCLPWTFVLAIKYNILDSRTAKHCCCILARIRTLSTFVRCSNVDRKCSVASVWFVYSHTWPLNEALNWIRCFKTNISVWMVIHGLLGWSRSQLPSPQLLHDLSSKVLSLQAPHRVKKVAQSHSGSVYFLLWRRTPLALSRRLVNLSCSEIGRLPMQLPLRSLRLHIFLHRSAASSTVGLLRVWTRICSPSWPSWHSKT